MTATATEENIPCTASATSWTTVHAIPPYNVIQLPLSTSTVTPTVPTFPFVGATWAPASQTCTISSWDGGGTMTLQIYRFGLKVNGVSDTKQFGYFDHTLTKVSFLSIDTAATLHP